MTDPTNDTCSRCGGSGWVTRRGEDGYERAVRCDCFDHHLRQQLWAHARIPPRHQGNGLHDLDPVNDDIRKAKEQAQAFLRAFPGQGRGLLLMGPPGVGKTHLAVGILKILIESHQVRVRFERFRDLLQEIRSSYDPRSDAREEEILRPALESDILLLDDLGAEKPTGWVQDTLLLLIDHRYNNNAITLITTNYLDEPGLLRGGRREFGADRQEMSLSDRIGQRLRSRLHEMCDTVLILGEDYRRRKDQGIRRRPSSPADPRRSR